MPALHDAWGGAVAGQKLFLMFFWEGPDVHSRLTLIWKPRGPPPVLGAGSPSGRLGRGRGPSPASGMPGRGSSGSAMLAWPSPSGASPAPAITAPGSSELAL